MCSNFQSITSKQNDWVKTHFQCELFESKKQCIRINFIPTDESAIEDSHAGLCENWRLDNSGYSSHDYLDGFKSSSANILG
jgi:hypothetical protein